MMEVQRLDRRGALRAVGALLGTAAGAGAFLEQAQAHGYRMGSARRVAGGLSMDLGSLDRKGIEATLHMTGRVLEGGVLLIDFPRHDITAKVHGLTVLPDVALDSEALFKQAGAMTMMMGELALLEHEVGPVLDGLEREGITVTALHNHLITSPVVLFIHFMAQGSGVQLARKLRRAVAPSGTSFGHEEPAIPASKLPFNAKQVATIIGGKGETSGKAFQVSVGRKERITMGGTPVPPSFGADSLFLFQPLGAGQAAMQSELVLVAAEVNPVIRTLRRNGVEVVAVHNHEIDEQPRLFYLHSWATGDAASLARVARAALQHTNSALS